MLACAIISILGIFLSLTPVHVSASAEDGDACEATFEIPAIEQQVDATITVHIKNSGQNDAAYFKITGTDVNFASTIATYDSVNQPFVTTYFDNTNETGAYVDGALGQNFGQPELPDEIAHLTTTAYFPVAGTQVLRAYMGQLTDGIDIVECSYIGSHTATITSGPIDPPTPPTELNITTRDIQLVSFGLASFIGYLVIKQFRFSRQD